MNHRDIPEKQLVREFLNGGGSGYRADGVRFSREMVEKKRRRDQRKKEGKR